MWPLQQELATRLKVEDTLGFGLVEMEELSGASDVHIRVGQEASGRTAFDDGAEDIRIDEVLAALRGEQDRGVALAPGLQRPGDVGLDDGIFDEAPGFIEHEELEPCHRS